MSEKGQHQKLKVIFTKPALSLRFNGGGGEIRTRGPRSGRRFSSTIDLTVAFL